MICQYLAIAKLHRYNFCKQRREANLQQAAMQKDVHAAPLKRAGGLRAVRDERERRRGAAGSFRKLPGDAHARGDGIKVRGHRLGGVGGERRPRVPPPLECLPAVRVCRERVACRAEAWS